MAFIVFKSAGDEIIINSEKIVAVALNPANGKTLIKTDLEGYNVNEPMDEVKKILQARTPGKKGLSAQQIADILP